MSERRLTLGTHHAENEKQDPGVDDGRSERLGVRHLFSGFASPGFLLQSPHRKVPLDLAQDLGVVRVFRLKVSDESQPRWRWRLDRHAP
jgi:hypothetical protein